MWVDERQRVHSSEPGHWTEAIRLSPSSHAAFRCTPPALIRDLLDDIEDDFFDSLGAQPIDPAEEAAYVERLPPA